MKNLKIKFGLFSLLAILAVSVFLTSCEQETLPNLFSEENMDMKKEENKVEKEDIEQIISKMKPLPNGYITLTKRMEELNIPDAELASMSTKELTETVLNYKYLTLMHTRNDLQSGFDWLVANYNGLQELINREDAAEVIFKKYSDTPILGFSRSTAPGDKGRYSFKVMFLEILLAQESIISNLSSSSKSQVAEVMFKNVELKAKNNQVYGYYSIMAPALAVSRMLKMDSNSKILSDFGTGSELPTFIEKGQLTSPETIEYIFSIGADEYIKK